jgi:hypothetical protein
MDLEALFDGVDGIKEDALEFGIMGASAVGAHVAYGMFATKIPFVNKLPAVAQPLVPIALGLAAGRYLGKMDRRVATGVAVGLVAVGVRQLVRAYAPASVKGALAGADEEIMLQGPGDAFLPDGEEQDLLNGYLSGAPITMEQVNGFDAVSVEESQLGAMPPFAAGSFTGAAALV